MAGPSPTTAQSPSRPLNPNMVYRPTSPPLLDLDDSRPTFKIPLHLVTIFRVVIFVTAWIVWGLWTRLLQGRGYRQNDDPTPVLIFVELFFVIFWSTIHIFNKNWSKKGMTRNITCRMGLFTCAFGSDDGDEEADQAKKNSPFKISWIIDLAFAVSLLVLSVVGRHAWWMREFYGYVLVPFYFLVALEFIVVVVSWVRFKPVAFNIVLHPGHWNDGSSSSAYIRLPEEDNVRALGGQSISIAA